MVTWILCPNLWGTRVFQLSDPDEGPKFRRELPRPKTQVRHEDFMADEDEPELVERPRDLKLERKVAAEYTSLLALYLDEHLAKGDFDSLILCAEEHLLKLLLERLPDSVKGTVLGTVAQDLYEVNESDLLPYVRDVLAKRPGIPGFSAA